MKYYCPDCKLGYIDEQYIKDTACPECGEHNLVALCERDRPCHCADQIHGHIAYCEVCGHAVCPTCGCHDVAQISRVTGYLNDVAGFNEGKKQEVKDRTRYNALTGEIVR